MIAYALLHVGGCGKPAFYLKRMPKSGDVLSTDDYLSVNGSKIPVAGEPVVCASCGARLHGEPQTSNVAPVEIEDSK